MKNNMTKARKIDIALIVGMIITFIFCGVKGFASELDDISNKVVRLHILANSDSVEDQNLKLKVRDEILKQAGDIFEESDSRNESEQIIINNINEIQNIAQQVVYDNGYKYNVKCSLVNMYFTKRVYATITMPEGYYDALRITIGEAKGHNWWCVIYPQLCLSPSIDNASLENFSEEEIELMTNPKKYKIKFKFVEIFKSIKFKFKWFD